MNHNRFITNQDGTAAYVSAEEQPPSYLVDLIPGAAEALAAWESANVEGRGLYMSKLAPADTALAAARRAHGRYEISPTDLRKAEVAHVNAQRDVTAAATRARAAAERFAEIVEGDSSSAETMRAAAAQYAAERHAELTTAWPAFRTLLEERERAYEAAGRPAWLTHWSPSEIMGNQERQALEALERIITKFPADVVAEAAEVAARIAAETAATATERAAR